MTPRRRRRYLRALALVAAGRDLSRADRIAQGLTWRAAAQSIGVSRERLHRIAALLREEYRIGRDD
jgi:hypothetical protein